MELKKEYREILNQLDPGEKKTVLEILERTDAVISKEKKETKSLRVCARGSRIAEAQLPGMVCTDLYACFCAYDVSINPQYPMRCRQCTYLKCLVL